MATRNAKAVWEGSLKEGGGTVSLGSGVYHGPYTYAGRFEDGDGTNPEELIGAAHAGCYAMFLSALLSGADFTVTRITADAAVTIETGDGGPTITQIDLNVEANVPGIDQAKFDEFAQQAKEGCPVSKALASVPTINLNAKLVG
ncbi:MAG: OsmC family peroxiredoxin [Chloroflexi bacterium]|nr:MAG: OsmC family peroxiredoxin [Chloroflexota bacterium]